MNLSVKAEKEYIEKYSFRISFKLVAPSSPTRNSKHGRGGHFISIPITELATVGIMCTKLWRVCVNVIGV